MSAHAGNDDPNVVHACIGNVSKVVRIVGVTGTCIASPPLLAETPAHWDIRGPQGAPGANGTNGTSGANGIDGTSVTFVRYMLPGESSCPNGGAIYLAANGPSFVCNGAGAAVTRADGPCFRNTIRYVDCWNGTVTDTVTGLIWLKRWNCLPNNDWASANQAAAALKNGDCDLTDNSSAGDWRLPTQGEWSATIARAVELGCASVPDGLSLTDETGTACGSYFGNVAPDTYWSSTPDDIDPNWAFPGYLGFGPVLSLSVGKNSSLRVWPVRGGPVRGGLR